MFGNCLIDMAARAAGFSDAQLAVIEKELPACRKLIDLIVKAQPLIQKFAPLVNEAEPLVKQAMPLVDEASKEIKAIAPAIQIVLGVVQRDLAAGHSVEQSFNNVALRIRRTFEGGAGMF